MRPQRPLDHYEPYLDGLFTYCLSMLCDHQAASTALGEALAVAERQRQRQHGRGRGARGHCPQADGEQRRAWLYALARWACLRVLAERREQEWGAGEWSAREWSAGVPSAEGITCEDDPERAADAGAGAAEARADQVRGEVAGEEEVATGGPADAAGRTGPVGTGAGERGERSSGAEGGRRSDGGERAEGAERADGGEPAEAACGEGRSERPAEEGRADRDDGAGQGGCEETGGADSGGDLCVVGGSAKSAGEAVGASGGSEACGGEAVDASGGYGEGGGAAESGGVVGAPPGAEEGGRAPDGCEPGEPVATEPMVTERAPDGWGAGAPTDPRERECAAAESEEEGAAPGPEEGQEGYAAAASEGERHRGELAALAWPEAAGTSSEQREALELAVRHQLAPQEVAAVLGRERDETRELLASAACEVERTRAALAVVELGSCPMVSRLALDNQVLLSAALRHELVRHVDDCRECRRRAEHATADGPWPGTAATAAALPVVEASRPEVHAAMLCALRMRPARAGAGPSFDRFGFPLEPKDRSARRRRRRGRVMAVAVVATVAVAPAFALWAAYRGAPHVGGTAEVDAMSRRQERFGLEERPYGIHPRREGGAHPTRGVSEAGGSRLSVEVLGASAGGWATRETALEPERRRKGTPPREPLPLMPPAPPELLASPLPPVPPASPSLSGAPGGPGASGSADGSGASGGAAEDGARRGGPGAERGKGARSGAGRTGQSGPRRSAAGPGRLAVEAEPREGFTVITLTASGGAPVRWTAATSAPWLLLSRTAGQLRPGESTSVTVAVDRDREPGGDWSARVRVTPGDGVVVIDGHGADRRPDPAPATPPPAPVPVPLAIPSTAPGEPPTMAAPPAPLRPTGLPHPPWRDAPAAP
ncbi:hypothetical protein ACFFHI_27035 [Streptomyces palmae]